MRRAAAAALACVTACWTGPEVAPPRGAEPGRPPPLDLSVSLERTACFGRCPVYTVTIAGDGAVSWHGIANVRDLGAARASIARAKLDRLVAVIDAVHFFELDAGGRPPPTETKHCTNVGGAVECEITFSASVGSCSDTSHAIVTIRQGARTHRVDDAHCNELPIAKLEVLVDQLAGTARWIGG